MGGNRTRLLSGEFTSNCQESTEADSIIKAFELGFVKTAKRNAINSKLNEIRVKNNRDEAIKDVLQFTMKSSKDQFVDELKNFESNMKLTKIGSRKNSQRPRTKMSFSSSKAVGNLLFKDLSKLSKRRTKIMASSSYIDGL